MTNKCLWCNKTIKKETQFTLKNEVHKTCHKKFMETEKEIGLNDGGK